MHHLVLKGMLSLLAAAAVDEGLGNVACRQCGPASLPLDTDSIDLLAMAQVHHELEDPAEDITPEIEDEGDEHQVFFTGSAVQGPATGPNPAAVVEHAYADTDADGLPLGLDNTLTTLGVGAGELVLTLRHLPLENDQPVKVAGMAEDVAEGGFGAIGGDNDVQITFNLEVE